MGIHRQWGGPGSGALGNESPVGSSRALGNLEVCALGAESRDG